VKSRFWTTFVAPKVAKGANARNGQSGMKRVSRRQDEFFTTTKEKSFTYKIFVVFELLSVKIGALFFVLNNSCQKINFQKINSYL